MDIIRKNEKSIQALIKQLTKDIVELSDKINEDSDKLRFLQRQKHIFTEALQLKEDIDKRFVPTGEDMSLDRVPKDNENSEKFDILRLNDTKKIDTTLVKK